MPNSPDSAAVPGSRVSRRSVGGSALLVGLVAIIVAAVLPLSALLLASRWATNEVTARTIAGARSTATAVVGQADQSYEDALTVVKAASARPSLLRALTGHDRASAVAGLANLRASGPFFAVQLLDRSGRVVASAPAGTTPSAPPAALPPPRWRRARYGGKAASLCGR